MKSEWIITILKSMALNYPIIREWGYSFTKVIRLTVPAGCLKWVIDGLSTPSSKMLNVQLSVKEIQKIVYQTNSGMLFVVAGVSDKSKRFLSILDEYAKSGAKTLFVYVTDNEIDTMDGDFFEILLDEKVVGCPTVEQLVPKVDELPLVKDVISKAPLEDSVGCERTLLASACFLYPRLPEQERAEILDGYFGIVRHMCDMNEANSYGDNIGDLFMNALYRYLENGFIQNAVELPNVEDRFEDIKDTCIFYDEKYIYMSTIFFEKVTEPLHPISPKSIKKALSDKDILVHDEGTYTKKMFFCRPTGKEERPRMLQFRKDLLVLPGQMSIIDLCMERSANYGN